MPIIPVAAYRRVCLLPTIAHPFVSERRSLPASAKQHSTEETRNPKSEIRKKSKKENYKSKTKACR